MRSPIAALAATLALTAVATAAAGARAEQAPASSAAPAPASSAAPAPASSAATPAPAAGCVPREADLGGIGRTRVVAFTGAIFGAGVCATVASLPFDVFSARIGEAAPSGALVVASLDPGSAASLAVRDGNLILPPAFPAPDPVASTASASGAAGAATTAAGTAPGTAPGPPPAGASARYVIAPGGVIADFNGDTSEEPRVILGYAGQRVFVIGTSPVELVDLARALRDQPDLFGADGAFERAILLGSGAGAGLALQTSEGELDAGTTPVRPPLLALTKR